jgi:hypothetical protein
MNGIQRDQPLDVDHGDGKLWFNFFCVVCMVKGFEDGFLDNSDLSFFLERVF